MMSLSARTHSVVYTVRPGVQVFGARGVTVLGVPSSNRKGGRRKVPPRVQSEVGEREKWVLRDLG